MRLKELRFEPFMTELRAIEGQLADPHLAGALFFAAREDMPIIRPILQAMAHLKPDPGLPICRFRRCHETATAILAALLTLRSLDETQRAARRQRRREQSAAPAHGMRKQLRAQRPQRSKATRRSSPARPRGADV